MSIEDQPGALPRAAATLEQPEIHHDHRDVSGGWLRPVVFGAMDGLVSNFALVAGVSGGGAGPRVVALTGFAGLVAGAFSMGMGEYTSVASQSEAAEAEIAVERAEILHAPEAEEAELAGVYRARGLDPQLAREVARQLSSDTETAVRIHAREELGIDPDDLPSPYVAAGSSFAAFAVGALVPLLPYLFGASTLLWPLILSTLGLFGSGAAVSRFTRRSALFSGSRQLVLGAVAAGITFVIGSLIGTGVA